MVVWLCEEEEDDDEADEDDEGVECVVEVVLSDVVDVEGRSSLLFERPRGFDEPPPTKPKTDEIKFGNMAPLGLDPVCDAPSVEDWFPI